MNNKGIEMMEEAGWHLKWNWDDLLVFIADDRQHLLSYSIKDDEWKEIATYNAKTYNAMSMIRLLSHLSSEGGEYENK